jgi:hypothetical protein
MCDMDRLSVLLHIPRIIDLCGDVPIQLVMYILCGHDGSPDSRGTQEDTLWKYRDDLYDTIMPVEIREKARIARIHLRLNPEDISLKVLAIVANGNEAVFENLKCLMAAARMQKEQRQQEALEGLPVTRTSEVAGMEVDTQDGGVDTDMSEDDSVMDALGVLE